MNEIATVTINVGDVVYYRNGIFITVGQYLGTNGITHFINTGTVDFVSLYNSTTLQQLIDRIHISCPVGIIAVDQASFISCVSKTPINTTPMKCMWVQYTSNLVNL